MIQRDQVAWGLAWGLMVVAALIVASRCSAPVTAFSIWTPCITYDRYTQQGVVTETDCLRSGND